MVVAVLVLQGKGHAFSAAGCFVDLVVVLETVQAADTHDSSGGGFAVGGFRRVPAVQMFTMLGLPRVLGCHSCREWSN